MAALIGGATCHSWGEVPIDTENTNFKDKKKSKDGHSEMFMKCASMRWLIIDEISTSSLWVGGWKKIYTKYQASIQVIFKNFSKGRYGIQFVSVGSPCM